MGNHYVLFYIDQNKAYRSWAETNINPSKSYLKKMVIDIIKSICH